MARVAMCMLMFVSFPLHFPNDTHSNAFFHKQGNLTSTENIGDSGLIHSWRAWKAHSNSTSDYRLPGLEAYTSEQLFFLAYGRIWASKILPSAAVIGVRTDPHSPPQHRVHGTISNMPEFAKAFNCSAKAKVSALCLLDPCLILIGWTMHS